MKPMLMAILRHDLALSWRRRGNLVGGVVFYVIAASLFPLAIGPDPQQLRMLAPGILWVAALLASMLSLSRLFAQEYADGSLDQLLLSPHPLALIVLTKIAAHWLASGLPLLLLTPILAQQYSLPLHATLLLTATLLIGTPAIALIGAVGAALTLGVRNGAALLCILVLPLCVPVLVFGAGAGSAADAGLDVMPHLSLLGACLALSLFVCPLATAAGLRIAVE
ncbi:MULTISPECIES: heme exporter protein CcmB [Ralstonia]|jgi:heme exporter protein B|uniref:Heme exporter protein B n=1 Tax=Ralstonia pickettii OR214 TaxID=1264675 RepID=R0CK28_RALPI|nr:MULTISPECIES: heme exporter protein CcmB [Ralstonia]MEA3271450.1 heme exporter protein CcmB [Pseudomonadota bacterium]ENZ76850.1 heme exporter protein CcmB [Ralstonia pickettii OR214]MBL4778989.1 heme exporter protein CcmB [Ralstonia sp.]MCM3579151.1 heme exporter protein CcmB [Ralstonia pickettii]MDR9384416.1 heme exporter protein CcmB [Ralstonia sp. 11b]